MKSCFSLQAVATVPPSEIFVTHRRLRDFGEDVTNGTLSQRAWCLQERAMSRRILHFDKDQLFWECLRLGTRNKSADEVSKFRDLFQDRNNDRQRAIPVLRIDVPAVPVPGLPRLQERSHMQQIRQRKPYGPWYGLVEQYTKCKMKYESDKLPAVLSLAHKFAEQIHSDHYNANIWAKLYAAGLWPRDLPPGLMVR
jgi:hypothetical protein